MRTVNDAMIEKRQERIEELATFGIKAERGGYLGAIQLNAIEAEKLLRILRRTAKKRQACNRD